MPYDRRRFEDKYLVDAEKELSRLGYRVEVFAFDFVPENYVGVDAPHAVADILVTNTETRTQKRYHREPGQPWHTRFIEELRAGEFGPPPAGLPDGARRR